MSSWTNDEIRDLYEREQARHTRSAVPHEQETLAHRCITIYEMWDYCEDLLADDETHKQFEEMIRTHREAKGRRMSGLSNERVDADPQAARDKVMMYVLNRMRAIL